jgi:hypothetical protein
MVESLGQVYHIPLTSDGKYGMLRFLEDRIDSQGREAQEGQEVGEMPTGFVF